MAAAAAAWAGIVLGMFAVIPVTKQQEKTGDRALGQDSLLTVVANSRESRAFLMEELLYCRFRCGEGVPLCIGIYNLSRGTTHSLQE